MDIVTALEMLIDGEDPTEIAYELGIDEGELHSYIEEQTYGPR